jgi:hypothetical protein
MIAASSNASSTSTSGRGREEAVRLSSAELEAVLLRAGARLVSRHEHGDFLEVRRRLLFVRHTVLVDGAELHDALRTAALASGHLVELLAQLRAGGPPSPPPPPPPSPRR